MTAIEKAIELLEGHPFYEILVSHVAVQATKYAQAKIVFDKRLGAGSEIDSLIRDTVFHTLKRRHVS